MSDKQVRKFTRYLDKLEAAARARKEANKARKAIRGLGGPTGDIAALASDLATDAVTKELDALRAERRALKKLHAFALESVGKPKSPAGKD